MRIVAFAFLVVLLPFSKAIAQDSIVLFSGKVINANVVEVNEKGVNYTKKANGKVHSINAEKVFSITKSDGTEQVVFKADSIEEPDLNVDNVRLFIKGEQAARANYHNNLNKAAAFTIGAGSSFFSIYGLIGPALYSSIVGSVSPDFDKQQGIDPALKNSMEYQEGYLKVARDKKIKNSYVAGMIGFVAGFTTFVIVGKNSK